jgi:hypothetical protein
VNPSQSSFYSNWVLKRQNHFLRIAAIFIVSRPGLEPGT